MEDKRPRPALFLARPLHREGGWGGRLTQGHLWGAHLPFYCPGKCQQRGCWGFPQRPRGEFLGQPCGWRSTRPGTGLQTEVSHLGGGVTPSEEDELLRAVWGRHLSFLLVLTGVYDPPRPKSQALLPSHCPCRGEEGLGRPFPTHGWLFLESWPCS